MRKIIFALLFCNQSFAQTKHGYFRDVDSTGLITIITTADSISNSNDNCALMGIIFNEDSMNHYFIQLKFKAPVNLSLSNEYKMQIKSKKRILAELTYWGPDEFVNQGEYVSFTSCVSEEVLKKMTKSKISSVSVIKDDFKHSIIVKSEFKRQFGRLSEFLLNVDVYKEKELTWSELSQFKFPEN